MRQYPNIYSQRDPQWANNELGTAQGSTIGAYGCLLTCDAMKAGYYGHTINPADLNNIYTKNNLYISQDLIADADITKVYPDIALISEHDYVSIPADLNALKAWSSDETVTVTIEIDFDHNPNDGIQTHFVELHSFDGVNLQIYDPWFGTDDNFATHYGTDPAKTIQRVAVYKGTPVEPGTYVDAKTFSTLVTKSTANDAVCDTLGLSHDIGKDAEIAAIKQKDIDKANAQNTAAQAQAQAAQSQSTITTLTTQVNELKTQVTDAQNAQSVAENALQLCQASSTHPDTGIDYKTLYEAAQSKLTQLQSQFQTYQTQAMKTIAQLQNTSYSTAPSSTIVKEALKRIFHLQ